MVKCSQTWLLIYKEIYPFSKIVGNANVLIMPALHSAAISTKHESFGEEKILDLY